jgi:IS30 family transposase
MKYHHLSFAERHTLSVLKEQGQSLRTIAKALGRSVSTVSRELDRNRQGPRRKRWYVARRAQRKADRLLVQSHRRPRLKCAALHQEVIRLLEHGWSPELISGRLKRQRADLPTISPEGIYQWIYTHRTDLIQYLARAHRKRRPRWRALKNSSTDFRPASPRCGPSPSRTRSLGNRFGCGPWFVCLTSSGGTQKPLYPFIVDSSANGHRFTCRIDPSSRNDSVFAKTFHHVRQRSGKL